LRRAATHDHPWIVPPAEAGVLVAEMERLREEVERLQQDAVIARSVETSLTVEVEQQAREVVYLRACVPPTHPSHYGYEAWEERLRAEVERERAAVVVFLHGQAEMAYDNSDAHHALCLAAESIERGEHRREKKP
jgi:hypothetical protein